MVALEIVIITVEQNQAHRRCNSVLDVVQLALIPVHAVLCQANYNASVGHLIPSIGRGVCQIDRTNAGTDIVILEDILLTVDGSHTLCIQVGTKEVLQTLFSFMPVTLYQLTILDFISNIDLFDCGLVGTIVCLTGLPVKEVPIIADSNPALG